MPDLFSSAAMALGYARSRPPLHERIVGLAALPRAERALDVGAGSGLSTRALLGAASFCAGIEPVGAMVHVAPAVAPGASFVQGSAERIPFRSGCFDLLTAAGSLNYVSLELFFAEARRVLTDSGTLLVYDFSQGRSFRESDALDLWYTEFKQRYPDRPADATPLDPEILAGVATGFFVADSRRFEIALAMTPAAYVDYAMTETNVAHAIRAGASEAEVRAWCTESVNAAFGAETRDVLFRGYYASLQPVTPAR